MKRSVADAVATTYSAVLELLRKVRDEGEGSEYEAWAQEWLEALQPMPAPAAALEKLVDFANLPLGQSSFDGLPVEIEHEARFFSSEVERLQNLHQAFEGVAV